jgi:hypothetical protein
MEGQNGAYPVALVESEQGQSAVPIDASNSRPVFGFLGWKDGAARAERAEPSHEQTEFV